MAGLNITGLPWPSDEWRVDLHSRGFETEAFASKEDSKRARMLRKRAMKLSGKRRVKMLALADQLDPAITPKIPISPTSARYIHEQRIRITGWIWKAVAEDETGTVARFDVIKPSWAVDRNGLRRIKARTLSKQFRTELNRSAAKVVKGGASARKGFLIAILHGDHEAQSGLYQPHWHLVATGDWVSVVEHLKKVKAYRRTKRVKRPIRARSKLTDLAYALSYLLKLYWPGKWSGKVSGKGTQRRTRKHQRIREPFHSALLLWLHTQDLKDMVLLMNVRAGKNGLKIKSVYE
jgi:hypothetical protein